VLEEAVVLAAGFVAAGRERVARADRPAAARAAEEE
jgi:hypothetical protein